MSDNLLYYGDNLDILRHYVKDESVDLIYLDPPFNSNATYNVLFSEQDGTKAAAQLQAFKDTWSWVEAVATYQDLVLQVGPVGDAMRAFGQLLPKGGLLAYLVMMAPRLAELRRVLKPTGSIYLHCDPTASHYLKVLMDAVFGPGSFLNEIIWQRTGAHNDPKRFGRVTDTILFFAKSSQYAFNPQYSEYDPEYIEERYHYVDELTGRRFWPNTMTAAGPGPARTFRGVEMEPPAGTHWRYSQDEIDRLEREGRIYYSASGKPYVKSFLDERMGRPAQNLWTDIVMSKSGKDRLGYPTQKPEALLERIIKASSNEGDITLDPFCGCGTAVVVAQKLNRRWIGIDITQAAIRIIKQRLKDTFGQEAIYKVIGEPTTVQDAQRLAEEDPYQFQWWATGLVDARPAERKKGADKGIDGRLYFADDPGGQAKQVILSVKAGHTGVSHVRDLRGVLDREKAEIGALITMHEPSGPMRIEAASAGFYESPWGKHPRLQILTIGELLQGRKIDYPPAQGVNVTFERAPKASKKKAGQSSLI